MRHAYLHKTESRGAALQHTVGGRHIGLVVYGLALLLTATSLQASLRQAASVEQEKTSNEVLTSLPRLGSTLTDAETAARGFVVTGGADFLPPQVNPDPVVGAGSLAQTLGLLTLASPARCTSQAAERETFKLRTGQAHTTVGTAQAGIIGGGALALAVAVVALCLIGADFKRRRRVAAELLAAHDQLEVCLRERTARLEESNQQVLAGEARYRDLVRLSAQAIFLSREGRIVFINEAGLRFFRAKHESEILGRSPHDFVHPDFRAVASERTARLLERPQRVPKIEQRFILPDGAVIDAEVEAASHEESGGLVIQVVCQDIMERKRDTLVAARLAAIVESSDDAIVGKTCEGIVTSWNLGAEKIFGFSAAEMVGQSIFRLIPPERVDEEVDILGRVN